jgi:hypothetical protein|tara:strand:- start:943 stop:1245 length:303 start_codon:yes stop_codon:yes gene_type:complete
MEVKAVVIHEEEGNIDEIDLDIDPKKNEIYKILSGRGTFIGQWPEIDVVIMKGVGGGKPNENTLPFPFHEEEVLGKILLIRMDKDSEPLDFTKVEFKALG